MNKIIKIEKDYKGPTRYKRVEWWLHNVCNFKCSFCEDEFKSGTLRWLELDTYKNFTSKLIEQSNSVNQKIFFQFLGGEPTLFPGLFDLSKHVVSQGHMVELMTNGSRTLNYWKDWAEANILNTLHLTIHPEQTKNIQHYVDLINLFEGKNTLVIARISAPLEHFNLAKEFCEVLNEQTSCIISLHPINLPFNSNYYTNEQTKDFERLNNLKSKRFKMPILNHFYPWRVKVTTESDIYYSYPGDIYLNNQNRFKGFECNAGVDFLKIFHENIYRANCEQDGVIGKISDPDAGFLEKPAICNKDLCFCRADILVDKQLK